MSFKHFCSALFITAAIAATISCKKDEDTETKPSLNGNLRFKGLPEYISAVERDQDGNPVKGDDGKVVKKTYSVAPNGVHHPENKPIGYYWRQTPRTDNGTAKNDTTKAEDGSSILKFKDSLYTCTVLCGAFADGYYDSSISTYTTIVEPGINGSVTNAGFPETYEKTNGKPTLFPYADDISDVYTEIGGYRWMRRNLSSVAGGKAAASGIPFRNCEAMDDVFGKYYTYNEAVDACPAGWELPDDEAWIALAKAVNPGLEIKQHSKIEGTAGAMMANALFNADVRKSDEENAENKNYLMWEYEPKVKITNATGLSVLPLGYADNTTNFKASFKDNSNKPYAVFVTGDPDGEDKAYFRYIIEGDNTLHIGSFDKSSFRASVRCVQKTATAAK